MRIRRKLSKHPKTPIQWLNLQLLEATEQANCPAIIEGKVNELESQRQAKIQQARDEAKKKEEEKKQTKKKTWTKEDVHILTQAMNKFPAGLANRWGVITEHLGDKFSKKEVIAKAQRIMDKSSMGMAGKDSFTPGKDKIIK